MDAIAEELAAALERWTIPYTRMNFADPGEWMQGVPLPE
jgi:hypothetical protein